MTPNAKRWIELDKQIESNEKKENKFSIGLNYDPIRRDTWRGLKLVAIEKQNALNMSEEDTEAVNDYYGCYCN